MLIDSEAGRLYMSGRVGNTPQVVALSAADGKPLATYPASGPFGLDLVNDLLYVDQGVAGLAVFNLKTGKVQATIPLPRSTMSTASQAAPQADPATGRVLVFRDNMIHVVDPVQGDIHHSISTSVQLYNSGVLAIQMASYDSSRRLLYLAFHHSPSFRYRYSAVVSYDLNSETEIARQKFSQSDASDIDTVASLGSLYGTSRHWFAGPTGSASFWSWKEGRPSFTSRGWAGGVSPGLQFDAERGRLYATTEDSLLVFDAPSMALLMTVPRPAPGRLVGYDPETDQLYFLTESGQLHLRSVRAVQPPTPEPLAAASPPSHPVRALALSPTWVQDRTMFAIRQGGTESEDYMPLDRSGGMLYLGQESDGDVTWHRSLGSLREQSRRFSALGVSPDYARDKTLLAGIIGMGVFRSTDGGRLWVPSSVGLRTMSIDDLLLSPDFVRDQTVFAVGSHTKLHRSRDGGHTWEALPFEPYRVAMSADFDQDHTLMAASGEYPYKDLHLSRDGGDSWEQLGDAPNESPLTALSLAPLFAKWQVAFVYEENGLLYRSDDGGRSWNLVLDTHALSSSAHLEYAPEIEVNRPLFLLVTPRYAPTYNTATGYVPARPSTEGGTLYRSLDGGQTWEGVQLPAEILPTAFTISPDFARDHLLYVGTTDGQVVALDATMLAGQP